MGRTPLRAGAVEHALAGTDASDDAALTQATDRAADGTTPPSDLSGQADYRQHVARVLTRRAVRHAAGLS
jgi:carbon-monoxide dehydrogenase medium subunit